MKVVGPFSSGTDLGKAADMRAAADGVSRSHAPLIALWWEELGSDVSEVLVLVHDDPLVSSYAEDWCRNMTHSGLERASYEVLDRRTGKVLRAGSFQALPVSAGR